MMAAAATRARRQPRRPFAPVVVSPPSQAENRLVHEDAPSSLARPVRRFGTSARKIAGPAVLGAGAGGKAAKKCDSGSSPVCASSKKTPAAVKRAPGTATRRLDSCTKNNKCSTPAAHDAPREPASGAAEERDDVLRARLSCPCSEAGRERRGSEASASRKRAMSRIVAMEEAMAGLPEPGEGRVKYLVDTFERLLSLGGGPTAWNRGAAAARRRKNQGTAAATASSPATPRGAEEIDVSHSSIASSSEVSFPAIAGVACILDSSDRTSMISRARGQRRQRAYNSTGPPSVRAWSCSTKVTRVTAQQPFRLRTEQRRKAKEGNFIERLRKTQLEEERLRNPLAQGLPYTTEEPEIPAKPPTREPTEPVDHVLHSEARVVRRVKFDSQVAERNSFMEEVKLERERQQMADEEIEIKQMRKQQVPRAHPMPDFSKPFVPKRSVKLPTVPREPRFQPRLPW